MLKNIGAYIQLLEERKSTIGEFEKEEDLSEIIDKKMSLHVDAPPERPIDVVDKRNQWDLEGGKCDPRNFPICMTESVMVANPKIDTQGTMEGETTPNKLKRETNNHNVIDLI